MTNSHNSRFAVSNFHIPHAGVLHGLAGYFEAVLYGSIGLSIHPHRKDHISKDMISWFPIYFPFRVGFPCQPCRQETIHNPLCRIRYISLETQSFTYRCGGSRINEECGMSGMPKRSCL